MVGGTGLRRNAAIYTASVDTVPVLKYNLNGYFSAAIHDSVSDQSALSLVRADGRAFLFRHQNLFMFCLSLTPLFYLCKCAIKNPAHLRGGGVGNGPESSGYNLSAHLLRTIFGTGIGAIFDHKPGREHAGGSQPNGCQA